MKTKLVLLSLVLSSALPLAAHAEDLQPVKPQVLVAALDSALKDTVFQQCRVKLWADSGVLHLENGVYEARLHMYGPHSSVDAIGNNTLLISGRGHSEDCEEGKFVDDYAFALSADQKHIVGLRYTRQEAYQVNKGTLLQPVMKTVYKNVKTIDCIVD